MALVSYGKFGFGFADHVIMIIMAEYLDCEHLGDVGFSIVMLYTVVLWYFSRCIDSDGHAH
jgi:hypothetical protein